MEFLRKIAPLFTVLGAIATILGFVITLMGLLPSNQLFIKLQIFGAESLAPEGYELIPSELKIIPEDSKFIRGVGGTALLTNKEITFAVQSDYHSKGTYVLIAGQRKYIERGANLPVGNTGCFLWLYHIDQPKNKYSYQLKCS